MNTKKDKNEYNEIPENVQEIAKRVFKQETEIAEKEEEIRVMRRSYYHDLEDLHREVLDMIGIKKKVIYTFSPGILCDNREVDAEVTSITVDEQGIIIVSFLKSASSYLFAEIEQPVFESSLKELLGTKGGRFVNTVIYDG